MIRKLAEELAMNEAVTGENEVRSNEESHPASQAGVEDYGFTNLANEGNARTQVGVLSDALGDFSGHARRHQDALAAALGEHVRRVSGSSAISHAAVRRHKNSR
jgi:hypothetical protein